MSPPGPASAQAEIATLKAQVASLQESTAELRETVGKLSDLSVSREGAKTRLNIAIGVAAFVATMTISVLVKSLSPSSPTADLRLDELREL